MKLKYIFFIFSVIMLASCSSAYRIGQTPDDVYYSPAPPQQVDGYVTSNNEQDKDSYSYNNSLQGNSAPLYNSGLSFGLGMGYNPYSIYGSSFYNTYSFYNPYSTGITFYPNYYNSFYSPYITSFNSPYLGGYSPYYSPFYTYYPAVYTSKFYSGTGTYHAPRMYNVNAYNNTRPVVTNSSAPVRTFTRQQQQPAATGFGGFIRRIVSPSTNTSQGSFRTFNNNNNYTPSRSTSSFSNSGGSSSGSRGGGGFRH